MCFKMRHFKVPASLGEAFLRVLNRNNRNVLSFVTFNVGWWLCALGAKYGLPWLGPLATLGIVVVHLRVFPNPRGEAIFIGLMTIIGSTIDTFLLQAGLFELSDQSRVSPPWLIAMWTLFSLTMESMEPLRRNFWLLLLSGAISGPLSYFAGEAMGRLLYARPLWITLVLHGIIWAALMPTLFWLRDLSLKWGQQKS